MAQQAAVVTNKVAQSGLITLDLEKWYTGDEIVAFDLKDFLHMELILKEKEFRESLNAHDWSRYEGKILAVYCSTDAIIASWAFMLVAAHAHDFVNEVAYGTPGDVSFERFRSRMDRVDWSQYSGRRVLLKGCAGVDIPPSAYLYATQKLLPHVERLMYGEACSFVPVYRAPKKKRE
ncbi:MAG: DUF2480 family protein [Balneolales bacterium]